jgi:hypothetical protein
MAKTSRVKSASGGYKQDLKSSGFPCCFKGKQRWGMYNPNRPSLGRITLMASNIYNNHTHGRP